MSYELKKYLLICLSVLCMSQFAHANFETSVHFGRKFGEDPKWKIGLDALYRIPINYNWNVRVEDTETKEERSYQMSINNDYNFNIALGLRALLEHIPSIERISLLPESVGTEVGGAKDVFMGRLALVVNPGFFYNRFFVGWIASFDIWTYLKGKGTFSDSDMNNAKIKSSQLLSAFSVQTGVNFGYKITSNFLLKLEAGYEFLDLEKCETEDNKEIEFCNISSNGIYTTVGISLII